ncbi:NAD(P)-binding protein [Peptostreptococcaceae bacterium AS15]|nr:NAD(P)-binding protein [Peptostreptococcaceae bacterium AS15]
MESFYPININLKNIHVLVVGMGNVAYRKLSNILSAKKIIVISKEIDDEKLDFIKKHENISYELRAYEKSDLKDINIVFACTNDLSAQLQIKEDVENSGRFILANYCKIGEYSNFTNMSTIQKDDIGIAVSTYGRDSSKTKKIRENLEKWYEDANC